MNNQIITINPTCNNPRVMQDLSDAYNAAMQIPFQPNISEYFYSIFTMLNQQMTGTEFLRDSECFSIYMLFERILRDSGRFTFVENLSERTIAMREPGYVYQIKIIELFASYHFITVVVGPAMNYVDVYQSFGSSMRLHHRRLTMRDFEKCISILTNIKRRGKNFFRDYKQMLFVDSLLYGVDVNEYLNMLHERFMENDEEPLDYTNEEIAQYAAIGIDDPEFGEQLKTAYELGDAVISINEYKPILRGGKGKKSRKRPIGRGVCKKRSVNKRSKRRKYSRRH